MRTDQVDTLRGELPHPQASVPPSTPGSPIFMNLGGRGNFGLTSSHPWNLSGVSDVTVQWHGASWNMCFLLPYIFEIVRNA